MRKTYPTYSKDTKIPHQQLCSQIKYCKVCKVCSTLSLLQLVASSYLLGNYDTYYTERWRNCPDFFC